MIAIAWPIALVTIAAMAAKCVALWLEIRAQAMKRDEERVERETGEFAKMRNRFDAFEADLKRMKVDQQTFMANHRAR